MIRKPRKDFIREAIEHANGGPLECKNGRAYVEGIDRVIFDTCKNFADTELGNADRFIAYNGETAAYVAGMGWLAYDGRSWSAEDGEMVVQEKMQDVVDSIQDEWRELATDKELGKQKHQHWLKSSRTNSVKASIAAAQPHLRASLADFDTQPHLFAVENGVIDLTTGILEDHSPEFRLTRLSKIKYDEDAACPKWLKFIDDITCGDKELAEFLQNAVGYSMYATQKAQAAFFLTGDEKNQKKNGSNGKSLFLSMVKMLFGDYGTTADRKLITTGAHEGGIPNDIARLAGRRFAAGSEFKKNDVVALDMFKKLTGDEEVQARFLRKEFFEFLNVAKLWFATNYVPLITDNDDGAWRRVVVIPFRAKFYEKHKCPAGAKAKDVNLKCKLEAELAGILNWAIEGAVRYAQAGYELNVPDTLVREVDAKKTDFDPLSSFLNICIEEDESAVIKAGDLRIAYERFCEQQGEDTITKTAFGRRLEQMGFEKDDGVSKSRGYVHRRGLRLSLAGQAYMQNDFKFLSSISDAPFAYRIGASGVIHKVNGIGELPDDLRRIVAAKGSVPTKGKRYQTRAGVFERVA